MKKKVISLFVAAAMLMSVSACSKDSEETEANETDAVETETAESEAEETEAEETVPEETEVVDVEESLRVVSLSPEVTEIIYALGAEDVLVGRSTYCDYPADVYDIPAVGDLYAMDIEAIAAVEPTVVLASSFIDDDTVAALQELGIAVVMLTEGTDIEGMYDLISEVASYLDCEDEADALIADTQAELDAIEAVETDASVYYVVGYGEYGDYTAGANTFIDSIITTAGAVNAAGDVEGWSIDLEALIEADPDIIIISEWMIDDFCATAPYSELTAVQNGNVISVDANLFERQTPRNVEAVQIIVDAVAALADEAEAA